MITDVFVFTRDLRLDDNTGLISALKRGRDEDKGESEGVQCVFIFRKTQIGDDNEYRSDNAIEFMMESLVDLEKDIRSRGGSLSYLYETTRGNKALIKALKGLPVPPTPTRGSPFGSDVSGGSVGDEWEGPLIHMSADYTPFAVRREQSLRRELKAIGWGLKVYDDHPLTPASLSMRSGSGRMYPSFSHFYNRVLKEGDIQAPVKFPSGVGSGSRGGRSGLASLKLKGQVSLDKIRRILPRERLSPHRRVKGGREEGLKVLASAGRRVTGAYATQRHRLDYETTSLSAYHHFGCVSIRETWAKFSGNTALRRQLIWRDFAYHRMVAWPTGEWGSVTDVGGDIDWKRDIRLERAWKDGKTGVPSVDAAMRQLIQEGYIHNRGRMIVANYLVKNLRLDWRIGERFFARWLTDYDWAVNFMNWVGIAGILPVDQPLRTMNPHIQAKKNDPDLSYIRKYVPELKDVPDDVIRDQTREEAITDKDGDGDGDGKIVYPAPVVGYDESRLEYRDWAKKYLVGYHPEK